MAFTGCNAYAVSIAITFVTSQLTYAYSCKSNLLHAPNWHNFVLQVLQIERRKDAINNYAVLLEGHLVRHLVNHNGEI